MAKTENVELTVLCLIQDGDKILLQNRVKKDWKGYTLPGGHVEPGESFVDAVKREMKEETGLDIINPKLAGIKQFPIEDGRYIVLLFKTEQFSGELVSSEEGQMEWIDCSRLPEIDAVDDLDELLRVINDPELTEFQYLVDGDNWTVSLNLSNLFPAEWLNTVGCHMNRKMSLPKIYIVHSDLPKREIWMERN